MKKLCSLAAILLLSAALHAQQPITRFLGIPVDGSKEEMIRKLEEKGYRYDSQNDYLTGEFNGSDVHISIATNNNKVWRIMVLQTTAWNATDIKIRFNRLCRQFENNQKYQSDGKQYIIPEEEDISYEIKVNRKRYQAAFQQKTAIPDSIIISNRLKSKYTEEQLKNPTFEITIDSLNIALQYILQKPTVWLTIADQRDKYYIVLYYDNKCNEANGEDL